MGNLKRHFSFCRGNVEIWDGTDIQRSGGGPAGLPLVFTIGYFGFQVGCFCESQAWIFFDSSEAMSGCSSIRLLASPGSSLRQYSSQASDS